MKIVMLGAPGAGKGTQAKRIADKYRIPHISTGDIFRANMKDKTKLGMEAKSYIDKGLLVPDSITIDMLMDRIKEADCQNGYVLDGFPRTQLQAESLTNALNERGDRIDHAINVEVPDEAIISRMSGRRACLNCGNTYHVVYNRPKSEAVCDTCSGELILRDDDKPETVLNRLKVYHNQTRSLIDYFKQKEVLSEVDGTRSMDAVFECIVEILGA